MNMKYGKLKSLVKLFVLSAGLAGGTAAYGGLILHRCPNDHLYVGDYCIHCEHSVDYRSPFTTGVINVAIPNPDLASILPWISCINNVEAVQYLLWEILLDFAHRFGTQYDLAWGEHDRLCVVDLQPEVTWDATVTIAKIYQEKFDCPDPNISVIKTAIGDFFSECRYKEAEQLLNACVTRLRELYPEVQFEKQGFASIYLRP